MSRCEIVRLLKYTKCALVRNTECAHVNKRYLKSQITDTRPLSITLTEYVLEVTFQVCVKSER